ncbi:MAG: His/Gly/Thr/Pro-type tRNA ligase C-terminal domain-containing protein, partial [Solirubrobacterales bacterium]|nr:His/Gly/Thr/Pro-type tRNA ligase C-terminal domain-containing protein [Solirubrobacterales bacterium]
NIFKLGTRYSEALGATFLDDDGAQKPIVMGSYGIGPARIAAAAVEQTATDRGIEWPPALAPWDIEVIALGDSESNEHAAAALLAAELDSAGASVLFDDRSSSPGEKFADADLVGCPVRLTIGRKGLEKGVVEARVRGGDQTDLPIADAGASAFALWKELS